VYEIKRFEMKKSKKPPKKALKIGSIRNVLTIVKETIEWTTNWGDVENGWRKWKELKALRELKDLKIYGKRSSTK